MMRRRTTKGERGAAAVEFALIVPLLVVLVFGVIEFGRVLNVQISLSGAAREGARYMAIHKNVADAKETAWQAAPSVPGLSASNIAISPSTCVAGAKTTVTVTYTVDFLTGYFGASMPLTGKGVMQCGG